MEKNIFIKTAFLVLVFALVLSCTPLEGDTSKNMYEGTYKVNLSLDILPRHAGNENIVATIDVNVLGTVTLSLAVGDNDENINQDLRLNLFLIQEELNPVDTEIAVDGNGIIKFQFNSSDSGSRFVLVANLSASTVSVAASTGLKNVTYRPGSATLDDSMYSETRQLDSQNALMGKISEDGKTYETVAISPIVKN